MSVKVQIIGGDRLKGVLARMEDGLEPHIADAIDEVADKVRDDAKVMCPVDTGSLQRSIRKLVISKPGKNRWEIGVRAGGYITNPKSKRIVDYAVYVEYGTSRRTAQPFLRPALLKNTFAIQAAVGDAINDGIEEAGHV